MAKSKNTSHHHQNRKDHRGGIKKPKRQLKMSLRGLEQKYVRNMKYAKKNNKKVAN
ncbi:60S ribosomal protein L29 [Intoshia linei]|uniref:60S ribosomal protein L29 n=1 Tax=Intoshia linei TaxID=1819745 RepID=A0A177B061_9BILA|nr:60S ribosomal protein L29 [Intoshia linei]